MIQENLHSEMEIRRFLLGEMLEGERFSFEEKFIADEDLFEQMRVVEDELIESYVRGTFSAVEKEKFERNFLSTEPRRRRVAFARTMLDKLAEQKAIAVAKKNEATEGNPSVRDSIANFFKTPKLAFGAAFALLILIFGGWLLLKTSTVREPEIAKQVTPTPIVPVTTTPQIIENNPNANLSNKLETSKPPANISLANANKNQTERKPSEQINPKPVITTLTLFTGIIRSEGKMSELNLPKKSVGANLQLNLESQDYKIYQVEIVDPDGNLVLQNNKLKAKNSKINLFVPAKKLRRGDYIVKLSALNPQNENESVADYSFRVNRK